MYMYKYMYTYMSMYMYMYACTYIHVHSCVRYPLTCGEARPGYANILLAITTMTTSYKIHQNTHSIFVPLC